MDTDEHARALIGTTVADKYRVLDVLGAGGMGTVYLAEHVFTKRRVALKRMHPQLGRSKLAAERFIRESQAPSTIGHPGIVQVLDGGTQPDGSLYIVHELLEGVSLSEAIARNNMSASAVIQLGVELLQALAAAHKKGIIHRDIKPDNVFIAQDGSGGVSIKLLDFGIASLRDTSDGDKLTRPGSVLGTAQYMSPEQAMAAPVDERSDLWSVGALLYHALCRQLPYPGETFSAVVIALATKQHISLAVHRPDLPRALVDVVERALRKAPDDRFASAAQMCAELAAVSCDAVRKSPPDIVMQAAPNRVESVQMPFTAAGVCSPPAAARAPSHAARSATSPSSLAPAAARATSHVERSATIPSSLAPAESRYRSTPSSAKYGLLAGAMLLCTLLWIVFHDRGSGEARATVGQLAAAEVLTDSTGVEKVAAASPHGLPLSALGSVLASRQAQLERCLQDSVVSQLLAGAERVTAYRLDVSLNVAPTGHVESVEFSGAAPADLLGCLRADLLGATFPPASEPTAFRYPLVLTPTVLGQ